MSEYKITMGYMERTEYECYVDEDGFASPGDIYDHIEDDPKYLVREIERDDDGKIDFDDLLAEFETYQEAVDYVKELKEKDDGHVCK